MTTIVLPEGFVVTHSANPRGEAVFTVELFGKPIYSQTYPFDHEDEWKLQEAERDFIRDFTNALTYILAKTL